MKDPNTLFFDLLEQKATSLSKWKNKKFEKVKLISTTEKGDLVEDFFAALLRECGYTDVKVVKSRRGDFDVSVGKTHRFEVKAASMDVNGSFQFNGIRYDKKYTHLFLMGITPNSLHFLIVPKNNLDTYTLTPMAKRTNSAFKLSRRPADMLPIETFAATIEELIPTS